MAASGGDASLLDASEVDVRRDLLVQRAVAALELLLERQLHGIDERLVEHQGLAAQLDERAHGNSQALDILGLVEVWLAKECRANRHRTNVHLCAARRKQSRVSRQRQRERERRSTATRTKQHTALQHNLQGLGVGSSSHQLGTEHAATHFDQLGRCLHVAAMKSSECERPALDHNGGRRLVWDT